MRKWFGKFFRILNHLFIVLLSVNDKRLYASLSALCEQAIRGFVIGKRNWHLIDTIAGAEASAVCYSIAETAKANDLNPYRYFEYLLTEIPKHMSETSDAFLEKLLLWSETLPAECRKRIISKK